MYNFPLPMAIGKATSYLLNCLIHVFHQEISRIEHRQVDHYHIHYLYYCNRPHVHLQYSYTSQVHIQHCTSFNIVCQPEACPCVHFSTAQEF